MNTYPPPHTENFAGPGATVGIQASVVNNASVYYQVLPDAPPEKKYEVGLKYLEDGVPGKAEELITAAMADGYRNDDIRFHWALAMLSKRSYHDLPRDQQERLDDLATKESDEQHEALDVVKELLRQVNNSVEPDTESVEKRIIALPAEQRTQIEHHLGLVLSGTTRDKLWRETKQRAADEQLGNGRRDRVWAYFQPEPVKPWKRHVRPSQPDPIDVLQAVVASGGLALAVGYLGWLTVSNMAIWQTAAYTLTIVAGFFGVRAAFEWRYRVERVKEIYQERFLAHANRGGRGEVFTKGLRRSIEHYFRKYRPHDLDADSWIAETTGIRGYVLHELSETYRGSTTRSKNLNWLMAYLARDVRRRYRDNSIHDYVARYQVPEAVRLQCGLGFVAMVALSGFVINTTTEFAPVTTWLAVLAAVICGPFSLVGWHRIRAEKHRAIDEEQEAERELEDRQREHERWTRKLEDTCPNETEMEHWLNCDKTVLIDEALRHYRLSWRDVIAYAVIQGPGNGRQRNRVSHGPWRYSRYDLRLFLITKDGVREIISKLNFRQGTFDSRERNNFRFEAVSSVNVAEHGSNSRTLNLTLMNGPARDIKIVDPDGEEDEPAEDPEELLEINLDTSGFTHALRILEGIAADGKGWIDRDQRSSTATR